METPKREANAARASLRYSASDLPGLPAVDGVRCEIIGGDQYVSGQPHWHHQRVCGRIFLALELRSERTGTSLPNLAPGLIFAADNDVAPDVVWTSQARLAAQLDEAGHLRAAPELVVEVLSPGATNERRDRELKLKLYSRQGVREYWLVDWLTRRVEVYRREGDALRSTAVLQGQAVLTSPLMPGFACPLPDLWWPPDDAGRAEA